MIDLGGSILEEEDERTGLVKMGGGKRDSEFDRCNRNTAFAMPTFFIPSGQVVAAFFEITRHHQFVPNPLNAVILDFLTVMGRIRLALFAIKIFRAHNFRRQSCSTRDTVHNFLD